MTYITLTAPSHPAAIPAAQSTETIPVAVDPRHITTGVSFSAMTGGNLRISADLVCFVAGTRLDTPGGPVAVEALLPGMHVLTAKGESRTVRWIGRRNLNLRRLAEPEAGQPIRVLAGAMGPGVPRSNVRLSPDHALLIANGEVSGLVPVRLLVNGATIRREVECRLVTYYHVELDTHDILLAEGLPAESYLDTGHRNVFANAGGPISLHPPFGSRQDDPRRRAESCAPFVTDAEQLEAIWRRITKRAMALGYAMRTLDTDPLLQVERNGQRLTIVRMETERCVVVAPPGEGSVRLLSRAASPHALKPWIGDGRRLGVLVKRLTVQHADGSEVIPLDHPMLHKGWWDAERHGPEYPVRWTDGAAEIPLSLDQSALLTIDFWPLFGYGTEEDRLAA